jgi:hypothetical protein
MQCRCLEHTEVNEDPLLAYDPLQRTYRQWHSAPSFTTAPPSIPGRTIYCAPTIDLVHGDSVYFRGLARLEASN